MEPDRRGTAREYSASAIVTNNLPYALMILLGATIIWIGMTRTYWGYAAASVYAVCGALGALWIICFLCPYCPSHGTRSCPCGYGILSARLRGKGNSALFARQFKRHIPMIVPLWIIPVVVGTVVALTSVGWRIAVPLGLFILDAFVVIPWAARSHGCKNCPQSEACPWMGYKQRGNGDKGQIR